MRELFRKDKRRPGYVEIGLVVVLCAAALYTAGIFFLAKMSDAAHKQPWVDERYGLNFSMRGHSYASLLLDGAQGQGSAAPLDYIAGKLLDQVRGAVSPRGLNHNVYLRLFSNAVSVCAPLILLFLFIRELLSGVNPLRVKAAQLFLLACLPAAYLFQHHIYYFAAEMRPYAVWTALFFMALGASLLDRRENRFFGVVLVLLAFSATAAIYQIFAIALAWAAVQFVRQRSFKDVFFRGLKLFALPAAISLYYCFRQNVFNVVSSGGTWDDFLRFWNNRANMVPAFILVIILCFLKKEARSYAAAPLAFLIVFMSGPLIFQITRMKSFFYAERQFIYYDTAVAILLLTAVKCVPVYAREIRSKKAGLVVLVLVCLLGGVLTFKPKIIGKIAGARSNAAAVLAGHITAYDL